MRFTPNLSSLLFKTKNTILSLLTSLLSSLQLGFYLRNDNLPYALPALRLLSMAYSTGLVLQALEFNRQNRLVEVLFLFRQGELNSVGELGGVCRCKSNVVCRRRLGNLGRSKRC
jgi:hypothetical protein